MATELLKRQGRGDSRSDVGNKVHGQTGQRSPNLLGAAKVEVAGASGVAGTGPEAPSVGDTARLMVAMAVIIGALEWRRSFELPDPTGLIYGILSVLAGQVVVLGWYVGASYGVFGKQQSIQLGKGTKGDPSEALRLPQGRKLVSNIAKHLMNPEGFLLIGGYLSITWMYRIMPQSYYDRATPVVWSRVLLSLLCMDAFQYLAHRLEHVVSPEFYKKSHKPHHYFTNPKLTDAFDGSLTDTACMIVGPLILTAQLVHLNMWSYAAFGTSYSMLLVLIHSEVVHPWDPAFRALGVGTSGDHHVHHKLFKYNFGHIFTYWDRLAGTYRDPHTVKTFAIYRQPT